MPTDLRKAVQSTWSQAYSSTISRLPSLSNDEQTRLSWAKPIQSISETPPAYKDFFETTLPDGTFPYTVLTPAYQRIGHHTTEKLICDFGDKIYVLERRENTYDAQCYSLRGISFIEARTILLDSSIKITGLTEKGVPASSTLRFNTVTDFLFTPLVEKMRAGGAGSKEAVQPCELEKFNGWALQNNKFMNFAKRSLLGGETVIHTILQPEIRANQWTFLGRTHYKIISPALMSILTDRELIMFSETARRWGEAKYGGIWDYVALDKITSLCLSEVESGLMSFSIQLTNADRLKYLFQASAQQELEEMLSRFREPTLGDKPTR
jgi:hypothetical protein